MRGMRPAPRAFPTGPRPIPTHAYGGTVSKLRRGAAGAREAEARSYIDPTPPCTSIAITAPSLEHPLVPERLTRPNRSCVLPFARKRNTLSHMPTITCKVSAELDARLAAV